MNDANETNMLKDEDSPLLEMSRELARVRRKESQRRSEAWAAVPELVLGLPLRPITPATFALLHATDNAFVCGLPPVERDVNDFILFHSPLFDPDEPQPRFWPRFKLAMQRERTMCPMRTPRGKRQSVRAKNLLRAIQEIRAIIEETWADALPGNDSDDVQPTPLACALTGQLIDTFAREYTQWPLAQPVRHTPLKQLFQLARCSERHTHGHRDTYFNAKENAVMVDFLARQNADPATVQKRREQEARGYDAAIDKQNRAVPTN